MRPFDYAVPETLEQARNLLGENPRENGAFWKGAGLDLLDLMKERILSPTRLVSLQGIPGLAEIRTSGDTLRIGAGVTLAALGSHPETVRSFPGLAEAAAEAATPQVRSRATVAGNLLQKPRCWYYRLAEFHCARKGGRTCFAMEGRNRYHAIFGNRVCPVVHPSNLAPMLVALDAVARLDGPAGERSLPVADLLVMPEQPNGPDNALTPGELVLSVDVPRRPAARGAAFLEAREKESFDWPLAAAAVALDLENGRIRGPRIVLGAVAPIPWRVPKAEAHLDGRAPDREAFQEAAELALQDASDLGENGFKIPLAKALVADALAEAARRAGS